jgi:hypothetical protein
VGQVEDVAARRSFLVEHPRVLQEFGSDLLQLLLNVFNGTVVQQVTSLPSTMHTLLFGYEGSADLRVSGEDGWWEMYRHPVIDMLAEKEQSSCYTTYLNAR